VAACLANWHVAHAAIARAGMYLRPLPEPARCLTWDMPPELDLARWGGRWTSMACRCHVSDQATCQLRPRRQVHAGSTNSGTCHVSVGRTCRHWEGVFFDKNFRRWSFLTIRWRRWSFSSKIPTVKPTSPDTWQRPANISDKIGNNA
jgi:hypothetical protein